MRQQTRQILSFFALIFTMLGFCKAQENYPIPPKNKFQLFYIQHNSNHNTFVYEMDVNNDKSPIKVYRIHYESKGEINELSPIQRKYAYGVNYLNANKTTFSLAAMKNIPFELKSANQKYYAEILINNKRIKVDRIFIHNDKNSSGLKIKVEYIMVYGKNAAGKSVAEKFVP